MTKAYEDAEKELDRLINLEKRLSDTNSKLLEGQEIMEQITKHVKKSREELDGPIRDYLQALIGVRMSFAREVKDILASARELTTITKGAGELQEFVKTVMILNDFLRPEMIEKLRRIIKE